MSIQVKITGAFSSDDAAAALIALKRDASRYSEEIQIPTSKVAIKTAYQNLLSKELQARHESLVRSAIESDLTEMKRDWKKASPENRKKAREQLAE